MQSTNGSSKAILYARVSRKEQAEKGYSIGGQLDELRDFTDAEDYEVVAVETDLGYSRETLARPGLDHVREMVAMGGVDAVVAWQRDRYGASPYPQLLADEVAEHGTRSRALDDSGDGEDAELLDGLRDLIAKRELRKLARRSRMGKLRKAREGKIIASSEASYGFTYTADRSGYIVNEREMVVLRRIFRMVGVEGKSLSVVKVILDREQVPTPGGARFWTRATLRALILDDVYKPHERVDIEELVTEGILSPEVASRLEESRRYGIWWYNRRRILEKGISEVGKDGRIYRRRRKTSLKPREEWIAVPVPDAGLEREVVEAAREAIRHNRKTSNAGHRFWELSGGISQCAECGWRMVTSVSTGRRGKRYFYYVCPRNYEQRWGACSSTKCHRAGDLEGYVWSLVSGLLKDPEHLRIGLERAIADERRSCGADPEVQERLWLDKLAEVDRKRSGFQDMAAEGLITFEELRGKLASLEETRETVKTELEVLRSGAERAAELERDKDALLDRLAAKAPERIDHATPEERHQIYNVLRLSVSVRADGALEVTGAFTDVLDSENTSRSTSKSIASSSRRSTQMRNAS